MNFVSTTHQLNSLFIYLVSTQNPNGELKTGNNKHKITDIHITRNIIPDKKCNTVQLVSIFSRRLYSLDSTKPCGHSC